MTLLAVKPLAPRVTWDEFLRVFHWNQGQHLAMIGPTESGKTNLAIHLLDRPKYVAVMATKPRDDTMRALQKNSGYKVLRAWLPWYGWLSPDKAPRRIIWPYIGRLDPATVKNQRERLHEAFQHVYSEGGWTLYVDELWYIINTLKLDFDVKMFLLQARSLNVSLAVATQRPAFVPLEVYDQSTHLFFWRDNDERNLSRISGINWRNANEIRTIVANLKQHEFLYVHNSGYMVTSTAPLVKGKVK